MYRGFEVSHSPVVLIYLYNPKIYIKYMVRTQLYFHTE